MKTTVIEFNTRDIEIELSGRGPRGPRGDCYFPYFDPDMATGHLMVVADTGYNGPHFEIRNDTGHLEVIYNGTN